MDDIVFYCACGQKIRAPGIYAGKKIKCPNQACGGKLTIPLPTGGAMPSGAMPPGAPPPPEAGQDPFATAILEDDSPPMAAVPLAPQPGMGMFDDPPPALPDDEPLPFPLAAPTRRPRKQGGGFKKLLIWLLILGILGGGGFALWKFVIDPALAAKDKEVKTPE